MRALASGAAGEALVDCQIRDQHAAHEARAISSRHGFDAMMPVPGEVKFPQGLGSCFLADELNSARSINSAVSYLENAPLP